MIKKHSFLFAFIISLTFSCNIKKSDKDERAEIALGKWRGIFKIEDQELPFLFEIKKDSGNYFFEIVNGEERIFADDISFKGDSFIVKLPVFDSEIKGKAGGDEINGYWHNNARATKNVIPLIAYHAKEKRFLAENKPNYNITGKWEISFYDPLENEGEFTVRKAIGEFTQKNEVVTGTVITPTGDLRYLEGVVDGDELKLSSFDGARAYLFKGKIENNKMEGDFWSGLHKNERWQAERNEDFLLPDADSLTFLKEGYNEINFVFPDLTGKNVSFKDEKYKDKVVIIQVMGSWCPNCLDETTFLSGLYDQYNSKGLEIIALAYETTADFNKAKSNIFRLLERVNARYDFLIAGTSNKSAASATLPFLNHVMAFPTSIFVDRKGKVRKIHTGFTGPGTGKYYHRYAEETTALVEKLLKE